VDVVASLSEGRTAAAQCGLFTYKSVPVIFEPPCRIHDDARSAECEIRFYLFFFGFSWLDSPQWARDSSLPRLHDHAQSHHTR